MDSSDVALQPVDDPLDVVDAMARPAGSDEEVALPRIADHLDRRLAEGTQPGEQSLPLADRAAVVALPVEDQGWRRRALDVVDGRQPAVEIAMGGQVAAHLVQAEPRADVRGAVERLEIDHGRPDDGRAEAIRVADGPGGHV